jgi:peptidoglycan hydrolase-like protein with peptidoglycan-binding domain
LGSQTYTLAALCVLAVSACQPVPEITRLASPKPVEITRQGPAQADPNACWGKTTEPAIYETVTKQIITKAGKYTDAGAVITPAEYKTVTKTQIVRERKDIWFETPCPEQLTFEFVASLQRALGARKMMFGKPTGIYDNKTRRAVRKYQAPQGLNSDVISLAAARQLGLVAIIIEE